GLLESTAGVQYRQGRYRAARRTCERIVELTEGTSARPSYAHAHMLLHAIYITTGDERRRLHRTQALETYVELGDVRGQARALNNLGTDAFYESRWSEAVEYFERSRLCEAADANDVGAAISDSNIAEVLSDQGSFDEAHTRLTRALRTFRAGDFPLGVAEVLNNLGRLEARRAEWARAESHLAEARRIVADIGADMLLPDVTIRDAELAVLRGQIDRAEAVLDACAALPESRTEIELQAGQLRAVIAARRGEDAVAEELLRDVIAATPAGSFSGALARHSLAVLLLRAGRPEAETHRHAALDTLRRLGVQQFRDPLAGDESVVIALPQAVVDLTQRQAEPQAAAV
ncbi:MAG: tetratricopeptide repeat protein, partial [Frankiales bacterium]|nr:tetratricopeptide repeat protein [Frankiales bacterium]